MASAVAIEPQRQSRQWLWQQLELGAQLAPQSHELEVRDMTIGEWKNEVRAIVRMEPNCLCRPLAPLRRHGDLRAIPPFVESLHDFGVFDLEFAEPPQRIADDRAFGPELLVIRHVLQLATAAVIAHVMRARRRDSPWPGRDDLADIRAREVAMTLERIGTQANTIPGHRARHEDDAAIAQLADPISAHGDPRNGHDIAHSRPSRRFKRRLSVTHGDCTSARWTVGTTCSGTDRFSSATIAAATASARSTPGRTGAANTRAPARSRYLMSISPFTNSASSMTRRWNGWLVGKPTITSSLNARRMR